MSRSSSCIQMLILLKARGYMTRNELAQELQCKKRNILEYKKELEEAGYTIEGTTGKYGGYALKGGTLLPVSSFTQEELRALQDGRHYLMSRSDFLLRKDYTSAMDKLQYNLQHPKEDGGVYMSNEYVNISARMQQAIRDCELAKNKHIGIEIRYRSMHSKEYANIRLHPYELIHYKGSYYCLGYSLKAKDYRIYKFSDERMSDLKLLNQTFQRDQDFRLKDHIGKSGLVKDETFEIELYVYHETARLIAEKRIGIEPIMKWIDEDTLYLRTIMEGKIDTIAFLLSLKGDCRLLSPQTLQKEMLKIIEDMKQAYSHS